MLASSKEDLKKKTVEATPASRMVKLFPPNHGKMILTEREKAEMKRLTSQKFENMVNLLINFSRGFSHEKFLPYKNSRWS